MARDSKGRFQAGIEIAVIDRSSSFIRKISGNFEALAKAGKRASRSFELAANMKHAADNVRGFSDEIGAAVKKPIKTFMDFEEQMSSVKAATFDLTQSMDASQIAEMDKAVASLSSTARTLGATTKYSALEAAAGMDILAKNFSGTDLEKAKAVKEAMPGILQAAAATKESIESTADVFSATMNQFSLKADDMGRIGDVFVKTANGSATGLLDLGEAMKYAGVTASQAGLDLETTMGIMGALGNAGKTGSGAGTGLASVLGNLQSAAKKPRSALSALGINIKDKQGNLRPILDILAEIDKAADKKFGKGKGGVKRDQWLQKVVGMGSDKETLAILTKQAGSGELQALVEANKKAAGTADKVAAEMNRNAAGAAKNLQSAMEELQLTIGETVIPAVTDGLKWLIEITGGITEWAKANPELVKTLASIAGGLALVGFAVAPVIKGVGVLVTMWGAFSGVATAVVGGFRAIAAAAAIANLGMLPLTAIIAAIAGGAYLIYEYWEPISSFFSGLWDGVTASFKAAMDWVLETLGWVGEQVEMFKVSILTPDQAAAYAAEKAATVEASARAATNDQYGGLFSDELDGDPNSQTRKGQRFEQKVDVGAEIKKSFADWVPKAANGPAAMGPVAQGTPLVPGQSMAAAKFAGELKITVDSPTGLKTELKQQGDPNFEVRVNRGSAAA